MSRRGNCHDNAVAESFFGALKRERIKHRIYPTRAAAASDVFDYIVMFYNPLRRHGSAGDLSPVEYEKHYALSGTQMSMKLWAAQKPRVAGLLVLAAGTLLGELSGVVLDDEAIEHGLHDSCSSAGELATASKQQRQSLALRSVFAFAWMEQEVIQRHVQGQGDLLQAVQRRLRGADLAAAHLVDVQAGQL